MRRLAIAIASLSLAIAVLLAAITAKAATPPAAADKNAPTHAQKRVVANIAAPAPGATAVPVVSPMAQSNLLAIITQDQTSLRAAPRHSGQQQALLWSGEVVEVRAQRLDYFQVYDHKRERGGFVHASQLRILDLSPAQATELLSVIRFVREIPGDEALGIGLTAAYLKAAPADVLAGPAGIEAFDALGTFADRLAHRASSGSAQDKALAAVLSAHLEVAARYGVNFATYEQDGHMQICYDGEAFRRVLAMPANAEQRARAALALTRHECVNPELGPLERNHVDEWRAAVLDRADTAALPGYLKDRLQMRRAGVWSSLAFQRARMSAASPASTEAANRAITELAGINKAELPEADATSYSDAAMRVSASRWAALPAGSDAGALAGRQVNLVTAPGQPGETCVSLVDTAKKALAKRCTYGIVWTGSATLNRETSALAIAVQPLQTWREMWVFRKSAQGWSISVLPPAATDPDVGYIEFAGWVPGGKQMLVAREAHGEGKTTRSFEVINLDTLNTERQVAEPGMLSTFQRWQDPSWKRLTLSLR
jgi:hypothetical protein